MLAIRNGHATFSLDFQRFKRVQFRHSGELAVGGSLGLPCRAVSRPAVIRGKPMTCRWWTVRMFYGLIVVLVASTGSAAGQATLRWNANIEPDLAGYNVYMGTRSGAYAQRVNVSLTNTPNAPEVTIGDLVEGYTYFFAVTAYDLAGNESGFSNEVMHTIADGPGRCAGSGSARVWGRIMNEADSSGIPGITLTLTGAPGCIEVATTRAWGLFWYTKLSRGTYTIIPTKSGCTFSPSEQALMLEDDAARVDFLANCP